MGPFLASFLFSLGVATWVYNKVQNRNGGLTRQSLTVAAATAFVAFLVFYTFFITVVPKN